MQQQIIKSNDPVNELEGILQDVTFDRLFILVDEHTRQYCLPLLEEAPQITRATKIVIPPDDTHKTLENLERVWKTLTHGGATRHSLLINLGGGMVTDLGGFVVVIFKRGI